MQLKNGGERRGHHETSIGRRDLICNIRVRNISRKVEKGVKKNRVGGAVTLRKTMSFMRRLSLDEVPRVV